MAESLGESMKLWNKIRQTFTNAGFHVGFMLSSESEGIFQRHTDMSSYARHAYWSVSCDVVYSK